VAAPSCCGTTARYCCRCTATLYNGQAVSRYVYHFILFRKVYIFLDFITASRERERERGGGGGIYSDRSTDISRILFVFNDFHRDTEIHVIIL